MNNKIKYVTRILYSLAILLLVGFAIRVIYGWYTSSSNDATFDSDEFMTVSQGYGGHFSTEAEYTQASDIHENSDSMITQVTVKPGDVIYYAFMFDVTSQTDIEDSYQIDNLLVYGANSTINYHGKTVGNYYSFLYNTGVEANSCHLFVMKKNYDSETNSYYYSETGIGESAELEYYTVNSTIVRRLAESKTDGANVSFSLQITMPNITSFPTNYGGDEKVYFMLYIPIWYQDIEENQNEEMDSYLKIASTVIVPVE